MAKATKNGGGGRRKSPAKAKPARGIQKPVRPDQALAQVVGDEEQPRTELTRRIWRYIKEHDLQDPSDRRMIRADERLRPLFAGKRKVTMFEMTRLVSQHVQ